MSLAFPIPVGQWWTVSGRWSRLLRILHSDTTPTVYLLSTPLVYCLIISNKKSDNSSIPLPVPSAMKTKGYYCHYRIISVYKIASVRVTPNIIKIVKKKDSDITWHPQRDKEKKETTCRIKVKVWKR